MLNLKNKTITITIVVLLMLSMTSSMVLLPSAQSHTPPWQIPTWAFISVAPNPVGVGQQVSITMWLDKVPIGAEGQWGSRWHGFKVTITKPDTTTEVLGPYNSDPTGGTSVWYTPTQQGTYKFLFEYPGQVAQNENPYPYASGGGTLSGITLGYDYLNDTFTASSATTTLIVQQDPLQSSYPSNPYPTEYWSRPINSLNRDWSVIGGNWLGLGVTNFGAAGMYSNKDNVAPYTTAPNSAHVIWTQPLSFGGQIGGESGTSETSLYATGTAYEAKFSAVILNGILYNTEYPGAGNDPTGLKATDLRTGQTVWERNITTPLRCGMILNFVTGDQYGAHAYLFCAPATIGFIPYPPGTTWEMYDAMTGAWILNIANASAGTLVAGPNGEILSYTISGGLLRMWNSTKCISAGSQKYLTYLTYSSAEIWRPPQGATIDWNAGYQYIVPAATNISGVPIVPALGVTRVSDDVVLATAVIGIRSGGTPGGAQPGYQIEAGYSASSGQLLWGPINRTLTPFTSVITIAGEGKYGEYERETMTWIAYDIKTGQKLWGPTQPINNSWAYHDYTAPAVFANGNLYSWGLAGSVYCFDAANGNLKWVWSAGNPGVDTPYGVWPLGTWWSHYIMADGKLYVRAGHDYTPPVFKGAQLYCINATTGESIWSSLSFDIVGSPAIADGIMVWFNGYDNQVYAYGKGPTKTTVDAPMTALRIGESLVIRGTVTDESPGTKVPANTARFPNGVPAIADANMSKWMEYLYQQQIMPANAAGVPVSIDVIDSNGNYRNIGTTTSDINGAFSLQWKPDITGKYTIIATFPGSESYFASHAETSFAVDQAAPTTAPTALPAQSMADTYLLPSVAAIIVAIAVVGIVLALLVTKKRP
jgi:outer membrane protein assembly factor BamB